MKNGICVIVCGCFLILLSLIGVVQAESNVKTTDPIKAAILYSESNMAFAKEMAWLTPEMYSELLIGFQKELDKKGLPADLITDADVRNDTLRQYPILFIVDTFSIEQDVEDIIRYYAQHGGIVVGINEVGRYLGGWTIQWRFEDLFGVKALPVDEWGQAISPSPDLFLDAYLTPEGKAHILTRSFSNAISFGMNVNQIWTVQPETAVVLAEYPSYIKTDRFDYSISQVDDPVVAVSVNDFGKGKGIWISPNMHQRDPDAWEQMDAFMNMLVDVGELVNTNVTIPPLPPKEPEVYLGINQIGFLPESPKKLIIRVAEESGKPFNQAHVHIINDDNEESVYEATITPSGPEAPWNGYYYIADFSSVTNEGAYSYHVELDGKRGHYKLEGGPIHIAFDLWSELLPVQCNFFNQYRCGEQCHTNDPVRGGYHDATGDYGVRMWSMPHVAYGFAECMIAGTLSPDVKRMVADEMTWTADWMLNMIDENGEAYMSVKPPNEMSPIELRPEQDPTERILETGFNMNYQLTYIAGMASLARAFQGIDPVQASNCLAAAESAYERIKPTKWAVEKTDDVGNFLWACTTLYQASGKNVYLERAKDIAPIIIHRQCIDPDSIQYGLCGDFYADESRTTFGKKQYKAFHGAGIYLGLLDMMEILSRTDPLYNEVNQAMSLFVDIYLMKGSEITPYGQIMTGLEREANGTYRVCIFTHQGAWTRFHGLNVDHFLMALVVARYAEIIDRDDMMPFVWDQLNWVVGQNPLGYCMMDYYGWNLCPMIDDDLGTGRIKGGVANGIIGDSKDYPTWGVLWNSREYWIPHNAYLVALIPYL